MISLFRCPKLFVASETWLTALPGPPYRFQPQNQDVTLVEPMNVKYETRAEIEMKELSGVINDLA